MGVKLIREKTCCFTGHRRIPDQDALWLRRQIRISVAELWRSGTEIFLAGGALGFDTMAAQEVIRLRENTLPSIRLVLVLPCLGQEKDWSPRQQTAYREILRMADDVLYTGDMASRGCYLHRDRFMVESSTHCIAYLLEKRRRSGTLYTVKYALRNGVAVINLAQPANAEQTGPSHTLV